MTLTFILIAIWLYIWGSFTVFYVMHDYDRMPANTAIKASLTWPVVIPYAVFTGLWEGLSERLREWKSSR